MKSKHPEKSPLPFLLALHGFTGDAYDFSPLYEDFSIRAAWRFVNLPGHFHNGEHVVPIQDQWKQFVSKIDQVMKEGAARQSGVYVLAYSMGARLLLKALLENDWKPEGLILIGATAGIELETERRERLEHDRELAEKLRTDGIDSFIDEWMKQPIIASQNRVTPGERILRKKQLNPIALAEALVEYSSGSVPPVWDRLPEIDCRVELMAGENDSKYLALHTRMAGLFPHAETYVIPRAGHAPHIERPDVFRDILRSFLT